MNTLRTIAVAAIFGAVNYADVASRQTPIGNAPAWATRELRAGIIGTDTSHVPQFTKTLNSHPEWKVKVVAAYKGGSPDLPISATRVDKFSATIQQAGVELVDSIDALLAKVDVVLLESVDGRPHLAQVTPVFKAGKRVFIDKPLAASLEDARRIAALSKQTGTAFFSASSARFQADIPAIKKNSSIGKTTKVQATYVLNKIDFVPERERKARVRSFVKAYGWKGPVFAIAAVNGEGCRELVFKIQEWLDAHPASPPPADMSIEEGVQ